MTFAKKGKFLSSIFYGSPAPRGVNHLELVPKLFSSSAFDRMAPIVNLLKTSVSKFTRLSDNFVKLINVIKH